MSGSPGRLTGVALAVAVIVAAGAAAHSSTPAAASECTPRDEPVVVAVVDGGVQEGTDLDASIDPRSASLVAGEGLHTDGGHGTAMAALVHATSPTSPILVVKVLDEHGYGDPDVLAEGIRLAADRGAGVINLSTELAGADASVADAIGHATASGALVVTAAGNEALDLDRHPSYPASYDDASLVVVAAADGQGRLAAGTNWGSGTVDLAAPGHAVPVPGRDGSSALIAGSSPAAAAVSGAAARLLALDASLSAEAIADALRHGARRESALAGRVRSGLLDLDRSTARLGCTVRAEG